MHKDSPYLVQLQSFLFLVVSFQSFPSFLRSVLFSLFKRYAFNKTIGVTIVVIIIAISCIILPPAYKRCKCFYYFSSLLSLPSFHHKCPDKFLPIHFYILLLSNILLSFHPLNLLKSCFRCFII